MLRCLPWERKIPGLNPTRDRIFPGSSHTSHFKIGTPVATLPGAWHYRVSAGTGWPGFSILWLGEMESVICNFYLSVAAREIVWADPSLRYTRMLLGRLVTNKQLTPVCASTEILNLWHTVHTHLHTHTQQYDLCLHLAEITFTNCYC